MVRVKLKVLTMWEANERMIMDKENFEHDHQFIVCPTWIDGKVQDRFLLNLIKYIQALGESRRTVPHFLSHNVIGERCVEPMDYM